ncbi:hypothetical protein Tco_1578447 [Tanacetum coccineum]
MADENLVIPLEEIQLDDKLHFIEEPVEIMDREVKQLKQSRIPIVKVRWNSRRGPEYTWEREDFFKRNYPHLFSSNQKTRKRNRAPGRRSLPAFLKELICKVLGLLVPLLELNQFGILLGELEEGQVASSGWPFVSVVPGQMTHLVASLTLDSARSCVMQGAFLTQGKASSIPIVFSWGSSISPDFQLAESLLFL